MDRELWNRETMRRSPALHVEAGGRNEAEETAFAMG